jgi:hypothetical protein
MAIYVYSVTDGSLYSWVPDDDLSAVADDATLAANNLNKVVGLPPLDDTHQWDANTLSVIEVAPPPLVVTAAQFTMLFTPAEFAAMDSSSDPLVRQAIFAVKVSQTINLGDPMVTGTVAHLVAEGFITQDRADAILAGQAPA